MSKTRDCPLCNKEISSMFEQHDDPYDWLVHILLRHFNESPRSNDFLEIIGVKTWDEADAWFHERMLGVKNEHR